MIDRYLRDPKSVRRAMAVIVTATAIVVIGAGALMRLIDHREYASIWVGMWWAIQTVTTVGYGDVTPREPNGRIVATFVERASRDRNRDEDLHEQRLEERLAGMEAELHATREQLTRIATALGDRPG